MRNPTSHIAWRCDACKERGLMARLDDFSIDMAREAIARGHERRAPACHRLRGTQRIAFQLDGKTYRFGAPAAPELPRSPNPPT